ncbi:GntR family transcriptional regulator [Salinibacterium xinjiangense]|uniref:Transcriptional regulator, GntR family n=1 Tax=Salinibacterium xinjiangense TaxID=386302 RepID=A0A2C8Y8I7_9MICO|nr:GntR family transcriptional regulator [Salinibacterium xinjiangense]GGK95778.1 GntR family transcriptional regulator [Salinibacterium xinjiangense]SOE46431.1 transcriptional regulator, GntR family [Salinibacterium xinjiangense]
MRASERAYAALRDDILEWRLEPGTVLGEVEQSERLGISRTPLREALARLLSDGLVAAQGGRGLVVTAVSVNDIAQLFELRQALEQQIARQAAQHGDPTVFESLAVEFRAAPGLLERSDHAAYYELVSRLDAAMDAASANSYLVTAVRSLRPHLVRLRRISRDNNSRLLAAAREHLLIVEAVAAGDRELAASATHVHLHQSLTSILATAQMLSTHR